MSQAIEGIDITMEAASDLSAKQYFAVKMSAADKVDVAGANEKAIGILQNEPESGEAALVRITGTSKVKSHDGSGIAVGDLLTPDANGKLEEVDADKEWCIAQALEASSADDDVIEAIVRGFTATI